MVLEVASVGKVGGGGGGGGGGGEGGGVGGGGDGGGAGPRWFVTCVMSGHGLFTLPRGVIGSLCSVLVFVDSFITINKKKKKKK